MNTASLNRRRARNAALAGNIEAVRAYGALLTAQARQEANRARRHERRLDALAARITAEARYARREWDLPYWVLVRHRAAMDANERARRAASVAAWGAAWGRA